MATEQYQEANKVDPRADIYGLAGTLYYMITGEVPFAGRGQLTVLSKKLKNEFKPPLEIVPTVDEYVNEIICRALDHEPKRRPRSCKEFADVLCGISTALKRKTAKAQETKSAKAAKKLQRGERRIAKRYAFTRIGTCRAEHDWNNTWNAEVLDISLTGVRLEMSRPFDPDTSLYLEVQDEDTHVLSTLEMRVCWVKEEAPNTFHLGCVFPVQLAERELDNLLDSQTTKIIVPR
jgi:serine/threonine protein kinase